MSKKSAAVLLTICLLPTLNVRAGEKSNPDVASPEAIVAAFFASGSGPAGPRDFARMRSLFAPDARVITLRRTPEGAATPVVRYLDAYTAEAEKWLATNANYEQVVNTWVERYANLSHVFCSFAARRTVEGEIFYRGVASFQLVWDGNRWWILTAYWQGERQGEPLPSRYRE